MLTGVCGRGMMANDGYVPVPGHSQWSGQVQVQGAATYQAVT